MVVPIWIRPTSYVHRKAEDKIDFHLLLLCSDFVGCNDYNWLYLLLKKTGPHEHNEGEAMQTLENFDMPIYHILPHKLQVRMQFEALNYCERNFIMKSIFPYPDPSELICQEGEIDEFQIFFAASLAAIASSQRPSSGSIDGKGIWGSQPSASFRVSW